VEFTSEEVESLVKGNYLGLNGLCNEFLLGSLILRLIGWLLLIVAYIHIELGNLVCILAGGWNFDWTTPVVVEEAESK
jgi:hypothetical protein